MTRSQIILIQKQFSTEDDFTFRRWIMANAVIGLIITAALVVMAVAGSQTQNQLQATTTHPNAIDISSTPRQGFW